MEKRFAVLGAGHGGKAIAAYLKLSGNYVRLQDRFEQALADVIKEGGIHLGGVSLEGFAKLDGVGTDIKEAVKGATHIFVVLPAFAHAYVAEELADCLEEGQCIILCPGSTGGVLEFKAIFKKKGVNKSYRIAETNSLFYAARSKGAHAEISGLKKTMEIQALPLGDTDSILEDLKDVYPQLVKGQNVLYSDLSNLNAIGHPLPVLLNTGWIESDESFRFYYDGLSPSIGALVEAMDAERLAIGEALGIQLMSDMDSMEKYYGVKGESLSEVVHKVEGYANILAPDTLSSRLLLEDIPMGVVPMAELGDLVGVDTPIMDLTIDLANRLLKRDFRKEGRTLEVLGIAGMSKEELLAFVQ